MKDEIERRHDATNARIRAGAKAGKFWLLRAEDREEIIRRVIEDTMSGAIGGFDMPMKVSQGDDSMGRRNQFLKKQKKKTATFFR